MATWEVTRYRALLLLLMAKATMTMTTTTTTTTTTTEEEVDVDEEKDDDDEEQQQEDDVEDLSFDIERFLSASHALAEQTKKQELNKLSVMGKRQKEAAYNKHASKCDLDDEGHTMALDDAGFRAACAQLNLIWDYVVLEDIINPSARTSVTKGASETSERSVEHTCNSSHRPRSF